MKQLFRVSSACANLRLGHQLGAIWTRAHQELFGCSPGGASPERARLPSRADWAASGPPNHQEWAPSLPRNPRRLASARLGLLVARMPSESILGDSRPSTGRPNELFPARQRVDLHGLVVLKLVALRLKRATSRPAQGRSWRAWTRPVEGARECYRQLSSVAGWASK